MLAPTGTIGLMMDCDTTGIEPELALVKTKKLVGGGTMQFVNQTVPRALGRLGYDPAQVEDIVAYIAEHNSVQDAPHLREEHAAVFDTAMGAQPIHYMGHVRMMAAAQPFISGAISKTVNMPEHVTVEEVEQLFVESWKLGLKAVAIYRDNCKVAQPLSADKKKSAAAPEPGELATPVRKRLPQSRPSITTKFEVGDAEGYITASSYPDDGIGEIFLKSSKQGSTLARITDAFSIAVSIGLQYGVPLETYVSKFINMKFEPSGMTNDPDVRFATSLVDYVFRRLALDHLPIEQREALGIRSIDERKETAAAEAAEKLGTTVEEVVAAVKAEAPPRLPVVGTSGVPQAQAADARSLHLRLEDAPGRLLLRLPLLRLDQRLLVATSGRPTLRPARGRLRSRSMAHRLTGIHHIQLAMPVGEEEAGRQFYGELLGLPGAQTQRARAAGGLWFRSEGLEVHLGVERAVPPREGASRFLVTGLDELRERLEATGTGSTRMCNSRVPPVPRAGSVRQPPRARRTRVTELAFRRLDPDAMLPERAPSRTPDSISARSRTSRSGRGSERWSAPASRWRSRAGTRAWCFRGAGSRQARAHPGERPGLIDAGYRGS